MPETWDYAKLGKTTWRATVGMADDSDPCAKTVAEREFPGAQSKDLAKAFVNAELRKLENPPAGEAGMRPFYWGRLERGTYRDTSFDDVEDGRVRDATWEPDQDELGERIAADAFLTDDRQIDWQDNP
jgi:hypothetical protein